jgi:hypothetical protein
LEYRWPRHKETVIASRGRRKRGPLDGSEKNMPDELIDLTKMKPSEAFGRFDKTDLIILLTPVGLVTLPARDSNIFSPVSPR